MTKTSHLYVLAYIALFVSLNYATAAEIPIVQLGEPTATIQIGAAASVQEEFAAEEIQNFILRFTQAQLEIVTNREPTLTPTAIVLGTPTSNPTINSLLVELDTDLGDEGYYIKTIEIDNETIITIAAHTARGVIYGAYALIEACITQLTGLSPVDLDFAVSPSSNLSLPFIDEKSRPFYPVRAVLEVDDPDWLARHRINMSGAEGIWRGGGTDDSLGTAFQYVDTPIFETLQDEPQAQRQLLIQTLRDRFDSLNRRGIDSYLFMYVTGEPTEALIEQRLDLLGPPVAYGASRNSSFYRPFCWSKPEFHALVQQLVQEIVKTYPTLSGFHLRSWGAETRACNCLECGDSSANGQALLWQVYFTIIDAVHEIRPDFKFYLSGYNRSWLKDPDGRYARQLPQGTIFSQKWGYDGEPIANPNISVSQINRVGALGHQFLILSHDVEEVVPFWMVEGDLFVQGVRQLANDPNVVGLGGFTVQGAHQGLGWLDRTLSARMNWDIGIDYLKLLENNLSTLYGPEAVKPILSALRINSWVLSSYFSDFAGSLLITGKYGRGSAAFATHFWDLIGAKAVDDALSLPDLKSVQNAVDRFASLMLQQQKALDEIEQGAKNARSVSPQAVNDLNDTVKLMRLWVAFFENRLHLVEAANAGYKPNAENQIRAELGSAIELSNSMLSIVKSFEAFYPVLNYSHNTIEAILLERLEAEIAWLSDLDAETLVRGSGPGSSQDGAVPLKISALRNYPNPFDRQTTLIYELSRAVDDISISIYTASGRQVRVINDTSTQEGYNEVMWDGQDADGISLANGVYLYKIRAVVGDEQTQTVSRLAILR